MVGHFSNYWWIWLAMCTKWMHCAEILIGHFREMFGNWPVVSWYILHSVVDLKISVVFLKCILRKSLLWSPSPSSTAILSPGCETCQHVVKHVAKDLKWNTPPLRVEGETGATFQVQTQRAFYCQWTGGVEWNTGMTFGPKKEHSRH